MWLDDREPGLILVESQMSSRRRLALAVIIGFLLGATSIAAIITILPRRRIQYYAVTKDIDLDKTYFFRSDTIPPLRGIIRKGSVLEVEGRHSIADYIVLRTVINHSEVQQFTREIPPPRSQSIIERQRH
jgi:hypothetical protein